MGFFSWMTQDTDRSICNRFSGRKLFPVTMIDNNGNKWTETHYEGYGEFGGKDFYELVAEMNGFESDRGIGIDLAYNDHENQPKKLIFPMLVENPDITWEDMGEPANCPAQGYFYEEDELDEMVQDMNEPIDEDEFWFGEGDYDY